MRISVSQFKKYQQCPRLYGIEYRMGYKDLTPKPWLEFGSKFDDLMGLVDERGLAALDNLSSMFPDPYLKADADFLARTWWNQYQTNLQPPMEVNGASGNQCEIELDLSHLVDDEFELIFTGFIDKVYEVEGEIAICERKTTSDAINPNSAYWDRLLFDPQIVGYSYGLSKMLGADVSRGTYEVFRKPNKTTLEAKSVPLPKYLETLSKALTEPSQVKRGASMVARKHYYISEDLRQAFERELVDVARDIHARTEAMPELEDESHAWPRNGHGCDLFLPCVYKPFCGCNSRLEDIEYITKQ